MGWISDILGDIQGGDVLFVVALSLLVGVGLWRGYWGIWGCGRPRPLRRFAGLSFQIGLTLMLERLYELSRAHVMVGHLFPLAYSNGWRIWEWELQHGFGFVELTLSKLFIHDSFIMWSVYTVYAFAHLFVTLGFLIWLYIRRNEAFMFVRNLFYTTTGVALAIYIVFPVAPPRLYSILGFPNALPSSVAESAQQTLDLYAAFPSLHLAYALIVGATLVVVGRHLWLRLAGALYPVVMLAVILISANHWVLDAAGSVVVVAGCAATQWAIRSVVRQIPPLQPVLAALFRRLSNQRLSAAQ